MTLETVYREPFPELNLRQWGGSIYTWLTHPLLDPTSSGRVVMDYLMKLVTTALEWSYAAGETDVRAETLAAAAELLTLRRDAIRLIDGEPPSVEVHPPEQEQGSVLQTETGEAPALDPPKRRPPHRDEMRGTQTEGQSAQLFFFRADSTGGGSLAAIDGSSGAMSNMRLRGQGKDQRAVCGDFTA